MVYERQHLRRIRGYVPGLQPDVPTIKLNTNENPFPPSSAVMARLAEISPAMLQRYPDPTATEFRAVVADRHRLTPDHVVVTNGGDELLRLALTTFLDPGRPLGVLAPSYGLYSVLARIHRAPLSQVPITTDWRIPDHAFDRWNAAGCQLAIVTNPHAPSGSLTPVPQLCKLARGFKGVLLVDEAYVDFVDPQLRHDATTMIESYSNILLLRTLSKGYSLAGLRIAYGLGAPKLVGPIREKTRDSYNVDAIAQAIGAVALSDTDSASASWSAVREGREHLRNSLKLLGLKCHPSEANFLLAQVPAGRIWEDAESVHRRLAERNIHVRWFDEEGLRNMLRISVGSPEENMHLVDTLDALRCKDATLD